MEENTSAIMSNGVHPLELERIQQLSEHEGIVWWAEWHPTGSLLATVGQDRVIRIWRKDGQTSSNNNIVGSNQQHYWRLDEELRDAHSKTIRRVSFSPCGCRLAAASFDGTVSIWQATITSSSSPTATTNSKGIKSFSGWICVASLEGHENEVKGVAWSGDGRLLATCGRDKTVWIWELHSEPLDAGVPSPESTMEFECLAVLTEHTQDVKMIVFSPSDDRTLFSVSYDDTIRVWRTLDAAGDDDWYCHQVIPGHSSTVWAVAATPNGRLLVSVGDDRAILFHRRSFGEKNYKTVNSICLAHERAITGIDISSIYFDVGGEHHLMATCGADRLVKLWKLGKEVVADQDHPLCDTLPTFPHSPIGIYSPPSRQQVNCARWHPHEPLLVLAGDQGYLEIIKIASTN